jgi:hypothetical protein
MNQRLASLIKRIAELVKADPSLLSMGKTQSGKDIPYDTEHPAFEQYNAQDHADAAKVFAIHAKNKANESLSSGNSSHRLEANKLLARASFHRDRERHHHWLAEHAAKEKAKATPNKFVHVSQFHSAILNRNPNPVQGQPKSLDDLTRLAEYHGKPQHEFSATPDKRHGYATYAVNPDKSLQFMHADYDSSD